MKIVKSRSFSAHILKLIAMTLIMSMIMGLACSCESGNSGRKKSRKHRDRDDREEEEEEEEEEETETEEEEEIETEEEEEEEEESKEINLYTFSDEVSRMAFQFQELHPDFEYDFSITQVATDGGGYEKVLDEGLAAGGVDAPDIYCAEASFVYKYTQGQACEYAASFEDMGIDVERKISEAGIAPYSVQVGTRPSDGKVVALSYQLTGGCMIYRSDLAKEVFGTDDPDDIADIFGGGSGSWDKFWDAAEVLKQNGIAIVSGDGDIWHSVEGSSSSGWVVDGKLNICKEREDFMDMSMKLKQNDYHNDTQDWYEGWYSDMNGTGPKQVFCFFGPAWLINFTFGQNAPDMAGQYRVTTPPVGFFWGGTWVMASKYAAEASDKKKAAIAEFLEWITLDTSDTGLQYLWANGLLNDTGMKDCVTSSVVMDKSDGCCAYLGGQNMFEYYVPAGKFANAKCIGPLDDNINFYWREQVRQYTAGEKTKEEALEDFKTDVYYLGISS